MSACAEGRFALPSLLEGRTLISGPAMNPSEASPRSGGLNTYLYHRGRGVTGGPYNWAPCRRAERRSEGNLLARRAERESSETSSPRQLLESAIASSWGSTRRRSGGGR